MFGVWEHGPFGAWAPTPLRVPNTHRRRDATVTLRRVGGVLA